MLPELYLDGRDYLDPTVLIARDRAETISVRFRADPADAAALWALLTAAAQLNTPWPAVPVSPPASQIIEVRPIAWHEQRHDRIARND